MKKVIPSLLIALFGLFLTSEAFAADPKPNILLIIADDMGYSDITCFGGEVQTPHLDALAKSGTPLLTGKTESVRTQEDWIGEELFGNCMIRQGDWKICRLLKTAAGSGEWQLFNLKNDPSETTDLSKQEPEKTKAMLALWDKYVSENGVILTDDGPLKTKAAPQE